MRHHSDGSGRERGGRTIDSFWDSQIAREIRWCQRCLRTRSLRIDGEPEQKARRGGRYRATNTQRDLVGQLRERDQHPLTGPVALDVAFHVGRPQSPGLHKLAKHLLDVLGLVQPDVADLDRQHMRSLD